MSRVIRAALGLPPDPSRGCNRVRRCRHGWASRFRIPGGDHDGLRRLGSRRGRGCWGCRGVFSDLAAGVGTYGVEIPEGCNAPSVWSTGVEIGEHLFNRSFGKAIGVNRLDGCRLRNRDCFGEAVDRSAAAEYQVRQAWASMTASRVREPVTLTSQ